MPGFAHLLVPDFEWSGGAVATGGLVGLMTREVRDIDEEAFRHDVVRSRFYGEMQVPGEGRYLQHTKVGGRESHELVAAEIRVKIAEKDKLAAQLEGEWDDPFCGDLTDLATGADRSGEGHLADIHGAKPVTPLL